jgi:hypothetical protein
MVEKLSLPKGKVTGPPGSSGVKSKSDVKTNLGLDTARRSLDGEERRLMISQAAYYIAQGHGFEPGHEIEDWLLAERQIDAALAGGELPVQRA